MFYRIYISFLILLLGYKLITNHTSNNFNVKIRRTITNIKRTSSRVTYYSNSTATFNAIIKLKFDIETNPGPTIAAPKCPVCEKTTRINQNRLICTNCFSITHSKCANFPQLLHNHRTPTKWTCTTYLPTALPFHNCRDFTDTHQVDLDSSATIDSHETILREKVKLLKLLHLNTQSLASSANEFKLMIDRYPFDIITISEHGLKKMYTC